MHKYLVLVVTFLLSFFTPFSQLKLVQKTLTELHVTTNSLSQMVRQPDGKTLILGNVAIGRQYKTALLRLDSSGVLDTSFGKRGIDTFITNSLLPAYDGVSLHALALQGDKILIGGSAYFMSTVSQANAVLVRLTSSGIIDSSFGTNGAVVTNTFSSSGISIDDITAIAVDGAGRIAVTGKTYDYYKYRFLVARYTPAGKLDSYFLNGAGVGVFDIGTEDDEALDIVVRPGNKLLILGKTYTTRRNYEVSLLALKNNGDKDSTFGINGVVVSAISVNSDIANKMTLQVDGKIVCAGNSGNSLLALRYKANGHADSSFGKYGKVIINVGAPASQANSIVVQPGGNIVIGGYATKDSINQFFAARLLKNGNIDTQFAQKGYLYKSIYHSNDQAFALCLLPGGRLLQGGQVNKNAATEFGIVQYTANGFLDTTFANRGVKVLTVGTSRDVAFNMAKLPWDNSFVLCGTANDNWCLVKYGPNKSVQVDRAFAVNGVAAVPYSYYTDQFAEPDIAVDSANKKIYMCGQVGSEVLIFKYNASGTPDTSFGNKGIVKYPGVYIFYDGLGVLPNGNIVFSALSYTDGFFAAMLKPDGTKETKFGVDGKVKQIPMNVFDLYVDNNSNTIKLGGTVVYNQAYEQAMCVYSLKFNGDVDAGYGQNGLATMAKNDVSANLYKYRITGDNFGRMLVSGGVQYDGYEAAVSRFTEKGLPDKTFGDNGMVITSITNNLQTNPVNEGIAAGGVSPTQGFVVTAGTVMDSYFLTASPAIVSYKNDGSIDSINNTNSFWDRSVFGGDYQSAYAVIMDSVKPDGYTLYVAGTGGKNGELDFALAKYERYYNVRTNKIGVEYPKNNAIGAVYPNPANSQVTVTYSKFNVGKISILITDVQGKVILHYAVTNTAKGWFTQTIQLPAQMTAGLYFLQVSDGVNTYKAKFIKQ